MTTYSFLHHSDNSTHCSSPSAESGIAGECQKRGEGEGRELTWERGSHKETVIMSACKALQSGTSGTTNTAV